MRISFSSNLMSIFAAIVVGLPVGAGATTINNADVSFSAYGLPAASGPVNSIDLTGDVGQTTVTGPGLTINVGSASAIVQGSQSGNYAAPVAGGTASNPLLWTAPYIAVGCAGGPFCNGVVSSTTLNFSSAQQYFGLLWGSVGTGDLLNFYSNGTLVDSLSGGQVINAASVNTSAGSQGFNGSQYTLVNMLNGVTFNSVAIEQTASNAFEAADFEYAAQTVSVPEPASFGIMALGLVGLGFIRHRQRKAV